MKKVAILVASAVVLTLLCAGTSWAQDPKDSSSSPKALEPAAPLYQDQQKDDDTESVVPEKPAIPFSSIEVGETGGGRSAEHGVLIPRFTFVESLRSTPSNFNPGNTAWQGQSSISGNLQFSKDFGRQFSMSYNGVGRWDSITGDAIHVQQLSLSEKFRVGRFGFILDDEVAYSPQSTFGFGGLQGLGGISNSLGGLGGFGIVPSDLNPALAANQSILSNADRVSNSAAAEGSYSFTARTSVRGSGSYAIIRGIDSDFLDTDQYSAGGSLNHQFSASSAVGLNYNYGHTTFGGSDRVITTQSPGVTFSRRLSSRFNFQAQAGAQFTDVTGSSGSFSYLSWQGTSSLSYTRNRNSASLSFLRGVSSGAGSLPGSTTLNATLGLSRTMSSRWSVSTSGGYAQNKALRGGSQIESEYVGAQISRSINSSIGLYFSYNLQHQKDISGVFIPGGFPSIQHYFSLGINWSGRPIHL